MDYSNTFFYKRDMSNFEDILMNAVESMPCKTWESVYNGNCLIHRYVDIINNELGTRYSVITKDSCIDCDINNNILKLHNNEFIDDVDYVTVYSSSRLFAGAFLDIFKTSVNLQHAINEYNTAALQKNAIDIDEFCKSIDCIAPGMRNDLHFTLFLTSFLVYLGKCDFDAVTVVKKLLARDKICVELGAGGRTRSGWIAIDRSGADINLDLTKSKLPFPDNSVDCFYSSHVFEHFSYPEPMLSILQECRRCLKAGGTFSICVPNAAIYVDAYLKGDYPEKPSGTSFWQPAFHKNSRMDILNYTAYMDGHHKHMFDLEGLLNILAKSGFLYVKQRAFDPTMDLENRQWESIYAVATK